MGNTYSSAPSILKEDTTNQPKNENQQATSSTPPIPKDFENQPKEENQQATSFAPDFVQTGEGQQITGDLPAVGLVDSLGKWYQKTKEHAETYPYVWGSYILVYGGFGLWLTYRWRKLRATEDRVRAYQARLRELVEAEESANAAKEANKGSTSSGKPSK